MSFGIFIIAGVAMACGLLTCAMLADYGGLFRSTFGAKAYFAVFGGNAIFWSLPVLQLVACAAAYKSPMHMLCALKYDHAECIEYILSDAIPIKKQIDWKHVVHLEDNDKYGRVYRTVIVAWNDEQKTTSEYDTLVKCNEDK